MATVVGTLQVDLVTNTASFTFDDAQLKAKRGAKGIQDELNSIDLREARGSIALLGEDIGVSLPRHLQTFIAGLPGVAPVMAAAFSAVAVVTLTEKIVEAISKTGEHKKKLEEQAAAGLEAANSMQAHASSLEIANLKLKDQIAILQKKPAVNGPKAAALEAKEAIDKLTDSFIKAIEKQKELFQSQVQGTFSKFLDGEGQVSKTASIAVDMIDTLKKAEDDYNRIKNLGDDAATTKALHNLEERKNGVKDFVRDAITQMETLSHEADKVEYPTTAKFGKGAGVESPPINISMDAERQAASQLKESLEVMYGTFLQSDRETAAEIQHGTLQGIKDTLEAAKRAAPAIVDLTREVNKKSKIEEMSKKITDQQAKGEIEAATALARLNEEQAKSAQKVMDSAKTAEKAYDALIAERQRAATQDKLDEIALQEATGLITKREALEQRINTIKQAQAVEEASVNEELQERKALLDQLAAQTGGNVGMAGMLGTDADRQAYNKALADYTNFQKQKEAIARQYAQQIANAQTRYEEGSWQSLLQRMATEGRNWSQQMQSVFKGTFDGMNSQLSSFLTTGKANWRQFAAEAITNIIMVGVRWVESHLLMAAANKLFSTQAEEDDAEQTGTTIATNVMQAESSAALAAANALASASLIDPYTAAAVAAGVLAEGEAFAAAASAAQGAVLPNAEMLVHTHPEEMILPKHISNFIVDSANRNASGGSGKPITQVYSPTFNHISSERYLQDMISKQIKSEMSAHLNRLKRMH